MPFLTEAFTDCSLRLLLRESGIAYPDFQSNMGCNGIRDDAVESTRYSARQVVSGFLSTRGRT